MKIVTDQMSHHSTSANSLEVHTPIQKPDTDSNPDINLLNGDYKILLDDISDLCHKKDADPLDVEIKDYIEELPGDVCSVVKESQAKDGPDDPLEIYPSDTRADMDNNFQFSADISGMECGHVVSNECSTDTDGSVLRDICIDEGLHSNDKIVIEYSVDGRKCHVDDLNDVKDSICVPNSVKVEVEWPEAVSLTPLPVESSDFDFCSYDSKVLSQNGEYENERSCNLKDKVVDTVIEEDMYLELLSKTCTGNKDEDKQNILHQESIAEFEDVPDTLICSSSTPEATIEETADNSTVGISEMKIDAGPEATDKNNPMLPIAVNNNELQLFSNALHHQMPGQQNLAFDHFTSARIQRDHFDSSFASVGHYTNSIAYTGSVAYSGSLSHRSDASTVSNRSFAFPVLQNEWNFSPVRMRKADRRHLGRRRGWMNGLFCCKF